MNYVFKISALDFDAHVPQLSQFLESRKELTSRTMFPGLWKQADRLYKRMTHKKETNKTGQIVTTIALIIVGLALIVPYLKSPQMIFDYIIVVILGLFFLGAGIRSLTRKPESPYNDVARALLRAKANLTPDKYTVTFDEDKMQIQCPETQYLSDYEYGYIECALETQDLFLVVFSGLVAVLQKKDLVEGDSDGLRELLKSKKVPVYRANETKKETK